MFKRGVAIIAVLLIGWWILDTGLQNKANNENYAVLRDLVNEVGEYIRTTSDTGLSGQFVGVRITSEGYNRIVYIYTYTLAADRTSLAEEIDRACASNRAHAAAILTGMESDGIKDPQLRVDYRHPGGKLDFSCAYPGN